LCQQKSGINVRAKYLEAFEKLKEEEHILIVDGSHPVSAIAEAICRQVQHIIKKAP